MLVDWIINLIPKQVSKQTAFLNLSIEEPVCTLAEHNGFL